MIDIIIAMALFVIGYQLRRMRVVLGEDVQWWQI